MVSWIKELFGKNRIQFFLFVCIIVLPGTVISIGETSARYENEVSKLTVYEGTAITYTWGHKDTVTSVSPGMDMVSGELIPQEETPSILIYPTKDTPLLLRVVYPRGCHKVVLGIEATGYTDTFPAGTLYSTDGGNSYRLNQSGTIEIPGNEGDTKILFIDLSDTEFTEKEYVLKTNFYIEQKTENEETETTEETEESEEAGADATKEEQPVQTAVYSANLKVSVVDKAEDILHVVRNTKNPVLTADTGIVWTVTSTFAGTDYEVSYNYLTAEGYQPVEKTEQFIIQKESNEGVNTLTLCNNSETKAPAGTYKIVITQFYPLSDTERVQLQRTEIPFFVNYR